MLRVLPLLLLGLATPALAQGVVGEGDQSQSVELLQGGVSVVLESSGSLSLGRGDPNASVGANLSVNDTTIVGVSGRDRSEQGPAGSQPNNGSQTVTPRGQTGAAGVAAIDANRALNSSFADCPIENASLADLENRLQPGQQIWLRPMDCAIAGAGTAELLAAYPQLSRAIADAGWAPDDAVAITISDDVVIIGMNATR